MANEVYELRVGLHNGRGNFAEMVHHIFVDNTSSADDYDVAKDICDVWFATAVGDLADCLGNDCVIDFVTARRVIGGPGLYASRPLAVPGTGGASSGSNGVSLCLRLITAASGPRGTGHMYIPALSESLYSGDLPNMAVQVSASAYASHLIVMTLTVVTLVGHLTVLHKDLGTWDNVGMTAVALKPITLMNKRTLPYT
jgi:hypothetical protein